MGPFVGTQWNPAAHKYVYEVFLTNPTPPRGFPIQNKKACDTLKISFACRTWVSVLIYTRRILSSVSHRCMPLMKYPLNELNQLEEEK